MNILLVGNGNMGLEFKKYYKNSNHKIIDTLHLKHKTYKKNIPIDIIIDFSSPKALNISLKYALLYKIPLILGTTSYSLDELERIKNASKKIPICLDSNYSIAFNNFKIIKEFLSNIPLNKNEYIIEKHHSTKKDSPSGSAKTLSNSSSTIYALRGGNHFGVHEVIYLFENEEISIKHTANNRKIFVEGVNLVLNEISSYKNGLYKLKDFIKETIWSNYISLL